jgi:tetratricopeptide (TPR) repeat protein
MNSDLTKVLPAFSAIIALLPIGAMLHAQSAEELIKSGDGCYAKLQAANALRFYLPAEKLEPNNERLLVHISREYRHLASDTAKSEEKRKLNSIAVDYAKRAAALGPNDPDAQLAVAISYGKLQPLQGNWDKIQASHIIKEAADKVVKLDPRNDLGWHVLGRWHQGIADVSPAKRALAQVIYGEVLPQSTYEEAAQCFQKAIELNPNRLMHYIELGRVYAQMGRTEEARRLITKGLSMQDTEKDDPDTKREGQEALAKLQ